MLLAEEGGRAASIGALGYRKRKACLAAKLGLLVAAGTRLDRSVEMQPKCKSVLLETLDTGEGWGGWASASCGERRRHRPQEPITGADHRSRSQEPITLLLASSFVGIPTMNLSEYLCFVCKNPIVHVSFMGCPGPSEREL